MSARVFRFSDYAPKQGEYSLLLSYLPNHGEQTIGVLLLDPETDTLHIRLRRDLDYVADEEDIEVLAELADDLESLSQQSGGRAVLERLENEASQSLRVNDREAITVRDFERSLRELYREHVPAKVLQFATHLPRYSLAVAAGLFLSTRDEVTAEEWIEIPPGLKLDQDMFVARIQGHSMEPWIPDGSLCVFRRFGAGSRNEKRVLVENRESVDDQYTVKKYTSEKIETPEGFRHTRIRLESLNRAYPSWNLDVNEDKYRVIAEFVRVLE